MMSIGLNWSTTYTKNLTNHLQSHFAIIMKRNELLSFVSFIIIKILCIGGPINFAQLIQDPFLLTKHCMRIVEWMQHLWPCFNAKFFSSLLILLFIIAFKRFHCQSERRKKTFNNWFHSTLQTNKYPGNPIQYFAEKRMKKTNSNGKNGKWGGLFICELNQYLYQNDMN